MSFIDFLLRHHPATAPIYSAYAKAEGPVQRMQKAAGRGLVSSATLGYVQPDKDFKEEGMAEKASAFAGELAGFLLPYSGASKAVKGLGVAGKTVASRIGKEALVGGALGLAAKPAEDESRFGGAAKGALAFGAFGGAGELLGRAAKKVAPKIADRFFSRGIDPRESRIAALRSKRAGKIVSGVSSGKLKEGPYKAFIEELKPYLATKDGEFLRTKKGKLRGIIGTTPKGEVLEPRYGVIKGEKEGIFTQKIFMDRMKTLGFDPTAIKAKSSKLDELLNFFDWGNKVNQKTGSNINVRDWVRTSNKAQNVKAGFEKKIASFSHDFKASGLSGKEFAKMVENQVDHPLVAAHRALTDEMGNVYQGVGGDFQFVREMGYAPRQRKVAFADSVVGKRRKGNLKSYKSSAEFSRTKKDMGWVNRVDDPVEWLKNYAVDVERQHIKSLLPEVNANYAQLKLLGLDGRANELIEHFGKASGVDAISARKIFSTNFVGNHQAAIDAALKLKDIDSKDVTQKVYQGIQRLMFKSWVGLSPTAHAKQWLQPYLVGGVEIGPKYVRYGLKSRKALAKENPELWARAKSELAPPREKFKYAETTPAEEAASQLGPRAKKVMTVAEAPGDVGLRAFTWQDVERNRSSIFWGGREKALKEGITPELLNGLDQTDINSILSTFKTKGLEEAAYEYGIVKSLRSNFMYSPFDKPMILGGRIGKYIPFTTWGRNQWMLYMKDVSSKNVEQLAKRIAYPLIILGGIEAVTGQELPNSHPASALKAPFQASIAPAVLQPIASLFKGQYGYAGKQALSSVPLASLVQRTTKLVKKGPTKGIGLKKAQGQSLADIFGR